MRRRGGLLLLIAGGAMVARLRPFRVLVAGDSMEPTLHDGDRLVVVRPRGVRRGDVVVVRPPGSSLEMVKRVAALPGEWADLGPAGSWLLGPGEYLVLGDNPGRSTDARTFGPVPGSAIAGRVVLRYWPAPGAVR